MDKTKMLNPDTYYAISNALLKGFNEAIEKCKPEPNAKPLIKKIESYYANRIFVLQICLIDAIEDNQLSDIEAIIRATDMASKIIIDRSFYLPITFQSLNIKFKEN